MKAQPAGWNEANVMYVVGLTGGIGSGKTAVSGRFERLGVVVVDADVVAREVVEPGSLALARIRHHFGDTVIGVDGELDRTALRRIVFSDAEARRWLESLLHPLIGERILQQLDQAPGPYAVLASPLLVESGHVSICNRVLVVDAPETVQLERTVRRDPSSAEEVQRIMASQASRQQRLEAADDVIDNSGDEAALDLQVELLHRRYTELGAINRGDP